MAGNVIVTMVDDAVNCACWAKHYSDKVAGFQDLLSNDKRAKRLKALAVACRQFSAELGPLIDAAKEIPEK